MKNSTKNKIDMGEMMLHVPDLLNLLCRKKTADSGILRQLSLKITTVAADFQGVTLYHAIGGVAPKPGRAVFARKKSPPRFSQDCASYYLDRRTGCRECKSSGAA
jgi:hypothetical protein